MLNNLNMGMLSFFLGILVLAVHANARNIVVIKKIATQDPGFLEGPRTLDGLPPEFFCNSCLSISRDVEKVLADPKLLEKASMIASELCHILPSDLQQKCLETSDSYIQQAILFLEDYFSEKKFCNNTGFCRENIETVSLSSIWTTTTKSLTALETVNEIMNEVRKRLAAEKEDLPHTESQSGIPFKVHLQSVTDKMSDNRSCTACHNALNELLDDLENPETKIKILKVLLKACEEVENHVKECKKLVFEYGPLILANVEKFIAKNDLCSIVHICNRGHQTGKATDV